MNMQDRVSDGMIQEYREIFAEAYFERALERHARGDVETAILDYGDAIRFDPVSSEAYYKRGAAYYFQWTTNRDEMALDAALADYQQALQLNPHYAEAYAGRGLVYEKQGRLTKANADYRRYIDLGGVAARAIQRRIQINEKRMWEER